MTECPKCKGYGIVGSAVPDILRGRGHIFSSNECDRCHGSGEVSEVQMTNEEYLKSCNTEQLAEWFTNSGFLTCTLRECDDCKYYDKKNDDCDFNFYGSINHKQMWVEWLKQPHREE